MPTAAIGDLKMHYLDQGSGQPVVLIHGNTSSSAWWEYTLQRVRGDYRFIAPDLRGRGDTEGPAADWTIETLADDVRGLVEHLGLGPAHFVGHSLGSDVALQYALDHPADVKSLTLLKPGWVAGDMPPCWRTRRASRRWSPTRSSSSWRCGRPPSITRTTTTGSGLKPPA